MSSCVKLVFFETVAFWAESPCTGTSFLPSETHRNPGADVKPVSETRGNGGGRKQSLAGDALSSGRPPSVFQASLHSEESGGPQRLRREQVFAPY